MRGKKNPPDPEATALFICIYCNLQRRGNQMTIRHGDRPTCHVCYTALHPEYDRVFDMTQARKVG